MNSTGITRLRRNVISNALGTIAPALAWILVVPVLVHSLGEQNYGVFTIAISFSGILGFLELGLTSAATKYIAEVETRTNTERLEKIISNNLTLYLAIGVVVTSLCFLFAPQIATLLFRDSGLDARSLNLLVQLIGVILSLTLVKNALASVLMGFQRYDSYNTIQIGYAIVLALVQGLIAANGGQVVAVMAGTVAVILGGITGFLVVIHRLVPNVRLLRLPDRYYMRLLFSFGMYMMVINVAATFLFNADKIVIGQILGPESVTYYAIPTQVTLKIHNGLAVFVSFIFPLASEVQSIGDSQTIKRIFLTGMRYITFLDGLVMALLGIFGREFLSLWIDKAFAAQSAPILTLTTLGYLLFAVSIIPYHMLMGLGFPRQLAIIEILTGLSVIVCLSIGLTTRTLIGGSFGALVGMGSMVAFPWYLQRKLGISWKTALSQGYGRNLVCAILGVAIGSQLPGLPERSVFAVVFVLAMLFLGNIRLDDWRALLRSWQRTTSQIFGMARSK
ncbi:MAG: oligosaccharide flippase family protein [Chloroflexi bacterium]|nr:oligosaccharide flippase family protein [Chloroflexota bacterium]